MSLKEMAYLALPRVVLILGLLLAPVLIKGVYWERVLTIVCLYGLLAVGFDFLAHYVGLVSLGGAFFVGVGGYISALLNTSFGVHPLIAIPMSTILGAAICTVLLLPCLPLRGVYFAIATLLYPLLAGRIIEALDILGGTDGLRGVEGIPGHYTPVYLLIIGALLFVFGLRRLVNEDTGLVLRAVKDNDQSVRASGISVTRYKALAVFLCALGSCFAGASLVHIYMWAGISLFALDFSILPISAAVVGGIHTLVGPLLGCLILVPISELLREFGTLRIVFYALILLAFIVVKSEGLLNFAQRKYHQFERWVEV
jgi:branched-chain amino acid transport system permease protein